MKVSFSFLSLIQGFYYFLTGLWPLFHTKSFELVTGPKTEIWLVKTVAVLVTIIGGVLIFASFRRITPLETQILATGSAVGLAAIEVFYVLDQQIPKIYLFDAMLEIVFIVLWILGFALNMTRKSS